MDIYNKLEQNYTAFRSYLHPFQFLWDALERSPFFLFWFVVSLLIFSKMLWWQVKFQSSWNASVPASQNYKPKKCVFPVCFFFPSSILQVSLQQKGFMNHVFGQKICYLKAFSVFCGCWGEHATNPGRGEDRNKRLHWYACGSSYLLARNKKKTPKAIICRSPLPGTLLKAAHPTAVLILWLDWILLKEWHFRAPL